MESPNRVVSPTHPCDPQLASAENPDGSLGVLDPSDGTAQQSQNTALPLPSSLHDKPQAPNQLQPEVGRDSHVLVDDHPKPRLVEPIAKSPRKEAVAIVGIACMFPRAKDLRAYWQNICNRVDAIQEVPPERWRIEDYFSEDRFARDRVYSRWGGFLDKVVFNPIKWHIPPASLRSIEPAQLLALEVASQAMADAGYDRRDFPRERTGVLFAVPGSHDLGTAYCVRTMLRHYLGQLEGGPPPGWQEVVARLEEHLPEWTEDTFPGFLANVVAGRISRELNLGGPNYVVDAACAATLAALHAGIEQLRSGTSDMVLVGGVDLTNNPFTYMSFAKTYALSPRGRSRPFDNTADGIALGEGVACIVLKRLPDAERDGDRIYAVIRGIGTSSDGKQRSLTAPSSQGQTWALERAYEDAGISPTTLMLLEAHGTGTVAGDSAELKALNHVFTRHGQERQVTAIGSVKSMIGHTKTVAGLAGLIKTALALQQHVLPPTIGVETPSKQIDFATSPFYLNTQTRPWITENGAQPRRAGVSAFGFGGTNFHVVLEEHTGAFHTGLGRDLMPRSVELFVFRRASREALLVSLQQLKQELTTIENGDLAELAGALLAEEEAGGRLQPVCRLAIVAASLADLRQKVEKTIALLPGRPTLNDPTGIYYAETAPVETASVCFLYPGQGSQTVDMLRDLLIASPWAHDLFGQANRLLADLLSGPLSRCIYPIPAFDEETRQQQQKTLQDTRIAQPALGLVELFATGLLARFGLRPGKTAGHSYGELVALHVAGCLSAEDLLRISAERGRHCAEAARTSPGGMVAVQAGAETTRAALAECQIAADLANLNAPDQTILAGTEAVLAAVREQLPRRNLRVRPIPVAAPFHTPLLRSASEAFAASLDPSWFHSPTLPVYSNTTGERYPDEPEAIREMLRRHLCEPIWFEKEVRRLHADGACVFVEVGPGKVLTDLVGRILKDEPVTVLALDVPDRDGWSQLGHVLARAAALGLPVDLKPWFSERGLTTSSLTEFFARARAEAKPAPTDWIISASRAEPVTPLPGRQPKVASEVKRPSAPQPATRQANDPRASGGSVPPPPDGRGSAKPTPPPAPATSPAGAEVRRFTAPSRSSSTATQVTPAPMITTSSENGTNGTHAAPGHLAAELFAQVQATTRQFLETQQGQQRLAERMLEAQDRLLAAQERMLLYCLQGAPPQLLSPPPVPPAPVPAAPAPAATGLRVRSVPGGVRPPVVSPGNGSTVRSAPAPVKVQPTTTPAPNPTQAPAVVAPTPPAGTLDNPWGQGAGNGTVPPPPPTAVFRGDLLQVVSERTGYPIDMLDEDLPLEAGLGIDSIKTVEIFSKLKSYHVYTRETARDQDEEEILTRFTKLRTLRDVIDSYDQTRRAFLARQAGEIHGPSASAASTAQTSADVVERYVVSAVAVSEIEGVKKNSLTATSLSSSGEET